MLAKSLYGKAKKTFLLIRADNYSNFALRDNAETPAKTIFVEGSSPNGPLDGPHDCV